MIDESAIRPRLEAEADSCSAWSNCPGTVYATNQHSHRKLLDCLRGIDSRTADAAVGGPASARCIEGQAG